MHRVSYLCKTKLENDHIFDGVASLYFNNTESIFVHEDVPSENSYIHKGGVVLFKKGDPEGFPVYINRAEKYLYYKPIYGSPVELFILKEETPEIKWVITAQTKNIAQFSCIRAIGRFGGRTYDVWFTPDIPVGHGPYKLGGLPGLILEAKSRDGMVSYEFLGFELEAKDHPAISKPQVGREVSWAEFEEYIINKLIRTEAMSTSAAATVTNNDPPADYTIEKSKFVIISRYKARRAGKEN